MNPRRVLPLLLATALLSPHPHAARAGARVVTNVGGGAWDEKTRKQFVLEKELSIGVEAGDGPAVFGQIMDIGTDARGLVYVLDFDQDRVQVFDGTGAFVRTVGRTGAGPGAIPQPSALALGANDTLYVASAGGVSTFDPDGRFVRSFQPAAASRVRALKAAPNGDLFEVSYDDASRTVIHRYRPGGPVLSFCEAMQESGDIDRMSLPTYAGGPIDLGADGTVYYSQTTPYEIREYSPDGVLEVRIFRDNDFVTPPRIDRHGSTTTLHPFAGSFGIFLLADGRLVNVVLIPGPVNRPGDTVLDLFDVDGRLLMSQRLDWTFAPRCQDRQGRFWATDYRRFPAVVRYRATLR